MSEATNNFESLPADFDYDDPAKVRGLNNAQLLSWLDGAARPFGSEIADSSVFYDMIEDIGAGMSSEERVELEIPGVDVTEAQSENYLAAQVEFIRRAVGYLGIQPQELFKGSEKKA